MKKLKVITTPILIILIGFISVIFMLRPYRIYANYSKSYSYQGEDKNGSIQEKSKYKYVGAEKCASSCHNNKDMGFQLDLWKKSQHAKAFLTLSSKKALKYAQKANIKEVPQVSAVCLKCHTTGEGLDSSSFDVTYKREDGVTCEACHKGEFISKAFLPKATDCLKCHNNSVHKVPAFDFTKECKKIAHPRPASKNI